MSFYGQVVYEFTKLFNKFKFKNSGVSNENFPEEKEPVSEFNYEANERWDELTFETGNRWVQMVPDMSAKSIKVFHAKPSDKVLNSSTFLPKDEADEDQVNLLDAGQCFEVPEYGIDNAGHISKINLKYYKLPITDFEGNLDELNKQMADLYEKKADQSYDYAESNVQRLDERIDELPTPYEFNNLKNQVGNLGNIYNYLDSNSTIVSTIGQVDGESGYSKNIATMAGENPDKVYSLSEAFNATCKQVISLQATLFNLQILIQSLTKRIEELENQ